MMAAGWVLAAEPVPPALLALDADGDGQPDVAEWFTGTDADDPSDGVRITGVERLSGPDRLRLTWASQPGRSYTLEGSTGRGGWSPLGQVTASGPSTPMVVPFSPLSGPSFVRVTTPFDAGRPPFLAPVQGAAGGPVVSAGVVALTVQAYHPEGLSRVELKGNGVSLGQGTRGPNGEWIFDWPADPSVNGTTAFSVVAVTASGLMQETAGGSVTVDIPAGPPLTGVPGQFVKLGVDGEPVESQGVRPDTSGQLPPCEWRPAGTAAHGGPTGMALRFPEGAKIVTTGGPRLEYRRVQLASRAGSVFEPDGLLEQASASPRSLALGPVTVGQLAVLVGLAPEAGVPIKIFGEIPARLTAGTLSDAGLRGMVIKPDGPLFEALPPLGGFEDFSLVMPDAETLEMPVHGAIGLRDAGGSLVSIAIGKGAPAWIRLERLGKVSVRGRGEVAIGTNGPRFTADIAAGDPELQLELTASGLELDLGASLLATLPSAQTLTAATPAQAGEMDAALRLLGAKVRAYERFAAVFADQAPPTTSPRPPQTGTSAMLDAAAHARLGGGGTTPFSQISAAVQRAARAATGATSVTALLEQVGTLERVRLAGFSSAELEAARDEVRAALSRRFDDRTRPFSLEDAESTVALLLQLVTFAQTHALTSDVTGFYAGARAALDSAIDAQARGLGVAPGRFDAATNPRMQALDPFTAVENLATLMRARRTAQQLGIDGGPSAPVAELSAQLGQRVERVLRERLLVAENQGDAPAFLFAFEDYAELHSWTQLGLFSGGGAPSLMSLGSILTRYSALEDVWVPAQQAVPVIEKATAQVRRLRAIAKAVPAGVSLPQASIERAYTRLDAALSQGISIVGTTTFAQAIELLRGGMEQARLRDQFSLPPGTPVWESAERLGAVVDRLVALNDSVEDAAAMHECALALLSEAERLGALNRQSTRRTVLLEAQKLAASLRTIALRWQSRTPLARVLQLPGNLSLEEAAGGFYLNADTRELRGWCSGRLKLPGLGAALTVTQASFSNAGVFSLSAHGSVTLPQTGGGAPGTAARFTVPPRRPLSISFAQPDRLSLAGGGTLEVNGMTFEAWASVDDPRYTFGASFSGLNFDLASRLRVMVPTWPNATEFPAAAVRDLASYLVDQGAAFEGLAAGLTTLPTVREPGLPPDADMPMGGHPFAALSAWANAEIADARRGVQRDYSATTGTIVSQLEALDKRLAQVAPERECGPELGLSEAAAGVAVLDAVEKAIALKKAKIPREPTTDLEAKLAALRARERAFVQCLFSRLERYDLATENLIFDMLTSKLRRSADGQTLEIPFEWQAIFVTAVLYHQRTFQAALNEAGLDPMAGGPANGGSTLKAFNEDVLLAHAKNMGRRRNVADVLGQNATPHAPGSNTQTLGEQAQLSLWLEQRERLVREARTLRTSLPEWPAGQPLAEVALPPGQLVDDLRAFAARSRALALKWNEYQMVFMLWGLEGAVGNRQVFRFSDGAYGDYEPAGESAIGMTGADVIVSAQQRRGVPSAVRWGSYPNIAGTRLIRSLPLEEGLSGMDKPVASYTAEQRARFSALGLGALSPGTAPPAVAALWRRYELARAGVLAPPSRSSLQWMAERLRDEVAAYVAAPAARRAVGDGLALARSLRALKLLAEEGEAGDMQPAIEVDFSAFDEAFRAAAVAQKAWWYLGEYTRLLADGAETYLDGGLTASASFFARTGSIAARSGMTLLQDMALLLPASRPLDVALPGDMRIDEVFGEISFDREIGLLSGRFGGRLAFPQIDAYFNLTELAVDNTGRLRIDASLASPLPVGGLAVSGTLAASGRFLLGPPGQPSVAIQSLAAAGSGTVRLPDGRSFSAGVAFDAEARQLSFTASGANLGFSLGDHFALLDGTAALRFGGAGPGGVPSSGQLEIGGTAGLLRLSAPPVGQLPAAANFHIVAENVLARLDVQPSSVTVALPQGRLLLPAMFSSPPATPGGAPQRASLSIPTSNFPRLVFGLGPADGNGLKPLTQVTFSGAIDFNQLGLALPGFSDVGARNFTGTLDFGNLTLSANGAVLAAQAPQLTITNGVLTLPHPLGDPPVELQASNIRWKLDGFPAGTLRLASDVRLFEAGGMKLEVLGAPGVDTTGLEIIAPAGGQLVPSLRFFGTVRGLLDTGLLQRETTNPAIAHIPTGQFGFAVASELRLHPPPAAGALPRVEFTLGDATVTGDFRLGGANGVRITGLGAGQPASVTLSGLGNLFSLADADGRRFVVTLNGKVVKTGGPGFGLGNSRFEFFDYRRLPRFIPGTLVYDGSSWTLAQAAPVELRSASLGFINSGTIDSLDDLRARFAPSNLIITSTFRIGFPSVAEAVIGGGADNIRITFDANGVPIVQGLEGIELTLDPGLKIPPIEDLGGSIYVTGFSDPSNLFLCGRLGGSVNGYKLKFLAAFTSTGPLGLAVDFNAGAAGIPLGPTGFLFTGAGGGISFLNTNADPADIKSYIAFANGRPGPAPGVVRPPAAMNWTAFKNWRDKLLSQVPLFPPVGTGPPLSVIPPGTYPANDPIGCPVDVPPVTANILGMPHPDQTAYPQRFIYKFTSIPEDVLNRPIDRGGFGITPQFIQSLNQSGLTLAQSLAARIRSRVEAQTPDVPAVLGAGAQAAFDELMAAVVGGFTEVFNQGIAAAGAGATSQAIYEAIREKAYAGVPVQDSTFAVKGVFTHAAVSSFLSLEGGGTLGTTGSAGVTGRVNFLGVPVGHAKLFLSATDANGNPNPQLTGDVSMALGPLEFGSAKGALRSEGALTGLAAVVLGIADTLGASVTSQILADINPDFAGLTLAQATQAVQSFPGATATTRAERLTTFYTAFVAQVFRRPPGTLPNPLPSSLLQQITTLFDQVNPELVMCADTDIKFAGIKLTNSVVAAKYRIRKTGREAHFECAPMTLIGYGTPLSALTSGVDRATMAYTDTFPDITGFLKAAFNGTLSSPQASLAFARQQVRTMLENSVCTGTYELNPLGMRLAKAQARLILPDLTNHPIVRNKNASATDNWIRPGTGAAASLPTREDVLLRAVRTDALGNVFWKGNGDNLSKLYPDGSPEAASLSGKTLTRDYFPHGGYAVASVLDVPRILTTLPRAEWAVLTNPAQPALTRLEAMRVIMRDYFGTTVQQGNFMAYVPAPNPPALFTSSGQPIVPPPSLEPYDLLESLKRFDPQTMRVGSLWSLGESFGFLNFDGQLIDIPIGTVNLAALGPDAASGAPARFTGQVQFPKGSWAASLFGAVNVQASVTGQGRPTSSRRPIDQALAELRALDTLPASPTEAQAAAVISALAAKAAEVVALDFPRVELDARISGSGMTLPSQWGGKLSIPAAAQLTLRGYSPEFLSALPANPSARQRLQKNGGVAVEGSMKFGDFLTTDAQVLIEPPTPSRPRPRATANFVAAGTPALPIGGMIKEARVILDSEAGTWLSITGKAASGFSLASSPWPVAVPADAAITVTNQVATITVVNGATSVTVTVNYANPAAPVVTMNGTLELDPLVTGVVVVEPRPGTGPKLVASVNGGTFATVSNARVRIGGAFNQAADLPAVSISTARTFASTAIAAPLASASLGGFSLTGLSWRVQATDGVLALSSPSATLPLIPGFDAAAQAFTGGTLGTDGSWSLTGSRLGLGVGGFQLRGASGLIGASLSSAVSGLSLSNTVLDMGDVFSGVPLGTLTVPANGAYSHAVTTPFALRGYPLGSASLRFQRAGSPAATSLVVQSSAFAPTGWPAGEALNLTGTVSSDGAFSLGYNWNSGPGLWRSFFSFPLFGSFSLDAGGTYASVVAAQSPAAWWRLDETLLFAPIQGQPWAVGFDSSGNGRNGQSFAPPTIGQPGARPSATNTAFRFDGVDDSITIPAHPSLNGTAGLTVSAWFKVNAFDRNWQTIISKGDSSWRIARNGSGNQIAFDSNHGTGLNVIASTRPVNDGQWHHVAGVFDGQKKSLFLDGRLEASAAVPSPINTNAFPVMIGENAQATQRFWNGWLDEVAVFGRALSADDVRRQFASGAGARLSFNGSLPLHPSYSSASFGGTVLADGAFDFLGAVGGSPTVLGYGFNSASLALSRSAGGSTASCTGRLRLNSLRAASGLNVDLFGSPPVFDASFTRSGTTTTASLTASGVVTPLGGYTPASSLSLALAGPLGGAGDLTFSDFQFGPFGSSELTNIGFGPLSGFIAPDGAFAINPVTRNLTLRNLTASNTTVNFSHAGLHVSGGFALKVQPPGLPERDFGNVSFNGTIQPGGTYSLTGSGVVKIGGFGTDPFTMRFRDPTQGTAIIPDPNVIPNLNFGTLDITLANFGLNRDGLSYSLNRTDSTGTNNRWVVAGVPWVTNKLDWSVSLGFNFNTGALTAQLTSTFFADFLPAAPKPPLVSTNFKATASGSINSDGGFTVNSSTTGNKDFKIPDWGLPNNAGWIGFDTGSFGFDLW